MDCKYLTNASSVTNIGGMAELTLKEYLQSNTQAETAKALGVSQGAISQMIASERDIRITTSIRGDVLETYEVKPLGKKKTAA